MVKHPNHMKLIEINDIKMKYFWCKTCKTYKLSRDMVKSKKDLKYGVSSLCRYPCKQSQNVKMHANGKKNKTGNSKENFTSASSKNRDVDTMEHPDKEGVITRLMKKLIYYHKDQDIYYAQLGLDYPHCKINGITQIGATREMIAILKLFKKEGIMTRPQAVEIDPKVIEAWGTKYPVDIINGSWEFADTLLDKKEHLFLYANTFGTKADIPHFIKWKKLNPEVLVLLNILRNGNVDKYKRKLLETFNNYNIYSQDLSTNYGILGSSGNMKIIMLIRKDINLVIPTFDENDVRNRNINEEYADIF